jgi:SLT domain-containing protein
MSTNKYYFVEKENKWNDKQSALNQKFTTGGMLINNLLPKEKKTPLLDNLGIPIGLIVENNTQYSISNKTPTIADTIDEKNFENFLSSVRAKK